MSSSYPHAPAGGNQRSALVGYARAVRAHPFVILLAILAAGAASLYSLSRRSPEYTATADLLVSPVPAYDDSFLGLSVIRDSGDPARTIQTAAALVEGQASAALTARRLGPGWTATRVRGAVQVTPRGESNVLAVVATAGDPALAARVANEFVRSTLDSRREVLLRQVGASVEELKGRQRRLRRQEDYDSASSLNKSLNALELVRSSGMDPSLSASQPATAQSAPLGAPAALVVGLALLAGLVLGSVAALLLEYGNRRIRSREELLHLYPLPVLAEVPKLSRRLRGSGRVAPWAMPPIAREALRTVRAQLEQHGGPPRTILVTSASAGDGKTTVAANLAQAFAEAGHSVILMDLDLRKPEIAGMLGLAPTHGIASLATAVHPLRDLLIAPDEAPGLRVLPALREEMGMLEPLLRKLPEILEEARSMADYVVLDTSPVGEVSDALQATNHVDDIILVARPGQTNRGNFELARDLLERVDARPAGIVLNGQASRGSSSYYAYGGEPGARAAGAGTAAAASRR